MRVFKYPKYSPAEGHFSVIVWLLETNLDSKQIGDLRTYPLNYLEEAAFLPRNWNVKISKSVDCKPKFGGAPIPEIPDTPEGQPFRRSAIFHKFKKIFAIPL